MACFYLFALGILSWRGLIYVPGLHSGSMYETPAERNNSLDAPCEVGPHRSAIIITHKWRMEVLEFPILLFFSFLFLSRTYVCLSARQQNQAPRFATQGKQPLNDCVMRSSLLRRWMMHSAWTSLKEITVRGDKGKVVDKSSNYSNHMQPCWPHIKTNLLLFVFLTPCPSQLSCCSHEENTLLKETVNKTINFCASLKCTTVCQAASPRFFGHYWFRYAGQ